jgi:UDP-2,3-diacylglucosamine hydrolase
MTAQFISDLHLDADRPDATACFLHYLDGPARAAEALYILGDLFDAWVGDDVVSEHDATVIAALRRFTAAGHRCALLTGNRDFLIGPRFAAATGIDLLADGTRIEIAGDRALLMHGDVLCTDDRAYQRYRRIVRNTWVQGAFLSLPATARRAIAARLRAGSTAANALKPGAIMDVNGDAVRGVVAGTGVRWLIHGHTHRPAVHRVELRDGEVGRIVLAAWESAGSVLQFGDGGPEFRTLPYR